jgi:HAD superfamily hydrolase (TIGR01484 family)
MPTVVMRCGGNQYSKPKLIKEIIVMEETMEVKLIVCDWEGCVVDPGGGTVAWDTHTIATLSDLINRLRSRQEGPAFVLCTGRQFSYGEAALQATNAFWDNLPSIFENGAGFYYPRTKQYIWNPAITDETDRAMVDVRKKAYPAIQRLGGVRELGKEYTISLNPPETMTVDALYHEMLGVLNEFREVIEITYSKSAVDITPKGVNKGSAVRYLSELTGIPLANMVGIGDSTGDIPMLSLVGHPTCPANADEHVREIAEYISPLSTTRGVIDIIRRYARL